MKNETQTTVTPTTEDNSLAVFTSDFFEKLEKVADSELKEIELAILNFVEGEVNNLIAIEITEKTFQDGAKDVVIFQDKTGAQKYNGNAYVVNAIKQIKNSLPFPVRIVCTGIKKGANGTYKTFSVKTLA